MSKRITWHVAPVAVFSILISAVQAAPKIIENFPLEVLPGETSDDVQPQPSTDEATPRFTGAPSVWQMPQIQNRLVKLRLAAAILFRQGKFADAEKVCQQSIQLIPHDAAGYYLLASAQGRQGKSDEALQNLSKAIDLGFNKSEVMQRDASFKDLHENLRFAELIASARIAEPEASPWLKKVRPMQVTDGTATVSAGNTGWDARHGVFISLFDLSTWKTPDGPFPENVTTGAKINKWYREGTAAGNVGDYYDNHDGGHSTITDTFIRQMAKIEFDDETKKLNFHSGLQTRFFYNGVVLGNSSTALVNSPYWRSQARLAYVDKRSASLLYLQYAKNHIYLYPSHKDHERDKGDVFPANTPYVIVTQGSSWTDKPAMKALAYTLAAFRPEVKEFLAKNGALMPTVQLIARICHDNVREVDDYLTGKAHPTVFASAGFNIGRMVDSAHALTKETVPPLVKLKVLEDDESVVGKDFFDVGNRQELFTTPCAIARVHRTTNYRYRMVVSAEESVDLNGRDLTYHWKVLRGDADKITIKPLNESGSQVELLVAWQPKQPIGHGSPLESNRVDIGCFVNNGIYYSAPAFVTFFTLANERRGYFEGDQVAYVEYKDPSSGGDYVDPFIDAPKTWKDVYQYDGDRLIGWTRERGDSKQHFTADGALILERDEQGRAKLARTVKYTATRTDPKQPPVLAQSQGSELLHYAYESADDRVGRVVKREPASAD